ncbi:MAG TPA: UvrD-helicase domain-containing protein [Burkholderiales bacterium]|nr:UvrD-helicase domain-containing protein [Burkholderiales bacterium]
MTAQIPDDEARETALDALRSFIVQAPAGSGKTGLLIQRYLVLLALVESPEEIVAVTFTIKAAGEMRDRVLKALADARDGTAPRDAHDARTMALARAALERDERRGWQIAQNPARLRIGTIDALCNGLTRQMPVLSRFGAAPEIIEDASEHYRQAARAAVRLVETDEAIAADVERLLAHLDNDVAGLETLLVGMLARRDQWIRRVRGLERAELETALAHERERLADRARALCPGAAPHDPEAWRELAQSLLTKAGEWRKRSPEAQALAAREDEAALHDAFADLAAMPPATYGDDQWAVLESIGKLLVRASAELRVVFGSQGRVDFTELAQAALLALGDDEPTDLALALDYRVHHLLIDEFQDTSITQYELIEKLTAGWEPGDGRTLFAVGDPMQSIYRFREAEVGEFLRTWESRRIGSVELERVRLTANFRSQAGVVDWVNAAFRGLMPAREDAAAGAVPYAESVPVKAPLDGDAVAVHAFFDGDEAAEAARVVEIVAAATSASPAETVAVLVRNRVHLNAIVPRLRAARLRFRAIDIEPLGHRPVVQDLLALTRALAHPADRIAWLACLRAPWCGLTLADLAALAEGDDARTVWELASDNERVERLTADGQARLARAREVLGEAIGARLRGRLREQVEGVWFALGGPACVEGETDLVDAEVYLDALAEAEEAGALPDLARFERRLAELWARPDVHAREGDVQLMTIHKAKGLEFDHVIVPGLGRKPREDDNPLLLWLERTGPGGAPELLVAPIDEAGGEGDAIYKRLKRLDAERDGHEVARLLYVATTRARKRLHLLGDTPFDARASAPSPPGARTLLAKLWPIVADRFVAAATDATPAPGARPRDPSALLDQSLIRLASDWRPAVGPPAAAWRPPPVEPRAHDEIEFSWVGETARHVGTVAHRWLQRIADDALVGWDEARIARSEALVRKELAALGVREAELDLAAQRAVRALRNAIGDERGRWVLGRHRHAVTEHRLTALVDGAIRRLVIDRLFVDESGERWIVDYKTSGHEGADVAAFLDREGERYAAQLERYARAAGAVDGRGLYFPLLRGWRET